MVIPYRSLYVMPEDRTVTIKWAERTNDRAFAIGFSIIVGIFFTAITSVFLVGIVMMILWFTVSLDLVINSTTIHDLEFQSNWL